MFEPAIGALARALMLMSTLPGTAAALSLGSGLLLVERVIKSYFEFDGKAAAYALSFSGDTSSDAASLLRRGVSFPERFSYGGTSAQLPSGK